MKKKPLVKYVGKYRELIPIGYTFHKLYANNYRTYQKKFKGEYSIWIFVAKNRFEIESLFDNSGWLIRCLIKNRKIIDKVLFHDHLWAILNTETGEVTRLDEGQEALEHRITKDKAYEIGDRGIIDAYNIKWKEIHIPKAMIDEVLFLYDKGLITLTEEAS